jgi:integrase
MASIYKPTRVDPTTGKRIKCQRWRIAFVDENGIRRTVKGYVDKQATQAEAKRIAQLVERRKAGIAPVEAKNFTEAMNAYQAEMQLLGRDDQYIREQCRQLGLLQSAASRKIGDGDDAKQADWQTVQDIKADDLRRHQAQLMSKGRAPRTLNTVRDALAIFCNFCVERGWLESNPVLAVIKRKAPGGQKRRKRRAYTPEELHRLLAAAPRRKLVYLVAALSGLRRSEIAQLQKCDLTPIGERPTWHLRPEICKGRRLERVPMLPECAVLIRELWQQLPSATCPLFGYRNIPRSRTMHNDLARAKINRLDDQGRQVDFHSLRYTFCTMLGRILPIQTVRGLMRHRDIRTTCNLYLDLGLDDVMELLRELPRLLPG